jgi:predicted amidohydrolase
LLVSSVAVACCQIPLRIGDASGNRVRTERAVRTASDAGARVIVLPELAATGYLFANPAELHACAEATDGPAVSAWAALSAELGAVLVAGFAERGPDGRIYNSAVLLEGGEIRARYRKAHLWDREKALFDPGDADPPVVETPHGRIGVMICYDLEFPEWVRRAALGGADLLAVPVNWPRFPRPRRERPAEIVRAQAAASENRMAIACCDRTGRERGQEWVGGSVILDQDGYPASAVRLGAAHTALAELDLSASRDKRISATNDVLADRRTDLYG